MKPGDPVIIYQNPHKQLGELGRGTLIYKICECRSGLELWKVKLTYLTYNFLIDPNQEAAQAPIN